MNLFSMHNNLASFLSGDMKAETEKMLDALGFVPKDKQQDAADGTGIKPEDFEKAKADAKAEGVEEGKAAAKKDIVERAAEIVGLCDIAGKHDKAADLIRSEKPMDEIKKELTNAAADEAHRESIQSTVSATGTGEVNAVLEDAKKRAEAAKSRTV